MAIIGSSNSTCEWLICHIPMEVITDMAAEVVGEGIGLLKALKYTAYITAAVITIVGIAAVVVIVF